MNQINNNDRKKVVKRVIEERIQPSTGRKVVMGFGMAIFIFGALAVAVSAVVGSGGLLILSLIVLTVGALMMRVGRVRTRKEEVTEEVTTTVEQEEFKN